MFVHESRGSARFYIPWGNNPLASPPEVSQSFKEVLSTCRGCALGPCCGLSAGCLPDAVIRTAGKVR